MSHCCAGTVRVSVSMLCVSAVDASHRPLYIICAMDWRSDVSQCVMRVRFEMLRPVSAPALLSEAGVMLWTPLGRVCSSSGCKISHYHMYSHCSSEGVFI